MCILVGTCIPGTSLEVILSFHHASPGAPTQVVRLGAGAFTHSLSSRVLGLCFSVLGTKVKVSHKLNQLLLLSCVPAALLPFISRIGLLKLSRLALSLPSSCPPPRRLLTSFTVTSLDPGKCGEAQWGFSYPGGRAKQTPGSSEVSLPWLIPASVLGTRH